MCATRQSDGEQRAQGDRDAPRELHAVSSSQSSAPPPGGGHGGLSGDTQPGDKPHNWSTSIDVPLLRIPTCFPERLGHDKMATVSRRNSERRLLALELIVIVPTLVGGTLLVFNNLDSFMWPVIGELLIWAGAVTLVELIPVPAWRGVHLSLELSAAHGPGNRSPTYRRCGDGVRWIGRSARIPTRSDASFERSSIALRWPCRCSRQVLSSTP